jgi:hypothetical protein
MFVPHRLERPALRTAPAPKSSSSKRPPGVEGIELIVPRSAIELLFSGGGLMGKLRQSNFQGQPQGQLSNLTECKLLLINHLHDFSVASLATTPLFHPVPPQT